MLDKKEKKEDDLMLRQEKFCQLYATDVEFFGNGVETYLEVYDIDRNKPNWYKTACSAASRLLSNVKVIDRISEILEEQGLNDAFVDKQLKFLLTQYADFGAKLGAIREYNKLKQRIVDRTDITSQGDKLGVIVLPQKNVDTLATNNETTGSSSSN